MGDNLAYSLFIRHMAGMRRANFVLVMGGIPMDTVRAIRRATSRRLVVAGGIKTQQEIDDLDALGMDAVVGMALYSGRIVA